jgi:formylglycine-generating enzyme required for sulfatase activity
VAGYTFISYAHENTRFALKLARRLRRRGVTVWVDQWHVTQDDVWSLDIARAVNGCSHFLVVLSPAAVDSWVVREQVQWAAQNGQTIISLVREPCELPEVLRDTVCIDFSGRKFRTAFGLLISHYFPEEELQVGIWPDIRSTWQTHLSELKLTWRNRLPPLIWPGWLGPVALAALVLLTLALIWIRSGQGLSVPDPTPESLTIVQSAATPTPTKVRIRAKDDQLMIEVPAGRFIMGSSDLDSAASTDEKPQRNVYVDTFWIDQTEVTNRQFQNCVEAGHCTPARMGNLNFRKGQLPVVGVNWQQAESYCRWAGVRLPTEAEWEKAARGTDGRLYPWGDEFEGERLNFCDANCVADWRDRSANDGYRYTAPVGSYPDGASPYGVLDMSGNVWEWTADWYAADQYVVGVGSNPTGPGSGQQKVIRGGSWYYQGVSLRVARRHKDVPTSNYDNIGFRCAIADVEQARWQPDQH